MDSRFLFWISSLTSLQSRFSSQLNDAFGRTSVSPSLISTDFAFLRSSSTRPRNNRLHITWNKMSRILLAYELLAVASNSPHMEWETNLHSRSTYKWPRTVNKYTNINNNPSLCPKRLTNTSHNHGRSFSKTLIGRHSFGRHPRHHWLPAAMKFICLHQIHFIGNLIFRFILCCEPSFLRPLKTSLYVVISNNRSIELKFRPTYCWSEVRVYFWRWKLVTERTTQPVQLKENTETHVMQLRQTFPKHWYKIQRIDIQN